MKEPAILLVTCCLEQSRYELVKQVFDNIKTQCPPDWKSRITVFDNASTFLSSEEILNTVDNVYRCDRNVGYWTAIDWWLESLKSDPPVYTYVIESDMMHYGAYHLDECVKFLDRHPNLGGMRLHEYSVENFHLYNKDEPRPDSKRNLWQSHTNKVTGQSINLQRVEGSFWSTNFLTQLPALNRYQALKTVFNQLHDRGQFTELDFQHAYHDMYPNIAIHDGGIFNCDLNPYGTPGITGSWTSAQDLQKIGYQSTRFATIVPRDQYMVTRLV